jgi:hypothetical protein
VGVYKSNHVLFFLFVLKNTICDGAHLKSQLIYIFLYFLAVFINVFFLR